MALFLKEFLTKRAFQGYETDGGKTYVSAVNPVSAFEVIKSEDLRKIAEEVSEKLKRVLDKVAQKRGCNDDTGQKTWPK